MEITVAALAFSHAQADSIEQSLSAFVEGSMEGGDRRYGEGVSVKQ